MAHIEPFESTLHFGLWEIPMWSSLYQPGGSGASVAPTGLPFSSPCMVDLRWTPTLE